MGARPLSETASSKRERQKARSAERRQQQQAATRGRRRRTVVVGAVAAALGAVVLVGGAVVLFRSAQPAAPPDGVEEVADLSRDHTEDPVDYPGIIPVGGPHTPFWQNCGFYDQPLEDLRPAVHSLEHGAVWIGFDPDLPADQVQVLRGITDDRAFTLAAPLETLPDGDTRVVASAWGNRIELDGVDDPDLEQFLDAFVQGPQTPEPNAQCANGVGEPLT